MPTLQDLSVELISSIIDKIYEEPHSTPALKRVSLVCRLFHEISSTLLFRHVTVPLTLPSHYLYFPFNAKHAEQRPAFLQFLHDNIEIRSCIRHITVLTPIYGLYEECRDLEESFRLLLPLLPRLQDIRIGGDECFDYDEIYLKPIHPLILSTIKELHRAVSLAVDCYVYPRDLKARLEDLSCLRSLRVCFLANSSMSRGVKGANEELGSNPFQGIVKLVSTNTRLKHLHLRLREDSLSSSPIYREMRDHALEILGPVLPDLESLVLEGDLHFTDKALKTWTKPLNQLQSLQIRGLPLVEQITRSLQGQMPALQTLKLSAFPNQQDYTTFHGDPTYLKAFLSTLVLTDLSLQGFPPDILWHALQSSGPTLRHLCFYSDDATGLDTRAGPPLLPTMLLSTEYLRTLISTCPALQRIILDVTNSSILTAEKPSQESPPSASNLQPSPIATSSSPLTRANGSLLLPLASMPALQHIHFFVLNDLVQLFDPYLTTADAVAVYAYLRNHKRGCPLKTLLICVDGRFYELWESAPEGVVMLEYRDSTGYLVREVWDLSGGVMRGREEKHQERRFCSWPVWGEIEGRGWAMH